MFKAYWERCLSTPCDVNTGTDQLAHPHNLIIIIDVCFIDSMKDKVDSYRYLKVVSDCS